MRRGKAWSTSSLKEECGEGLDNDPGPTEPLLNVADYFCWTIQNVFERGNIRYYNYLRDKISRVIDLYDFDSYGKENWPKYYGPKNPLTAKNRISPPSH